MDKNIFELINREKTLVANTNITHQRILYEIFESFRKYFKYKESEVFLAQFDLILDSYSRENAEYIVNPDIMVVDKEEYIKEDGIYGVPILIVEIISNSIKQGTIKKFKLYEKYGVKEYWVVDLNKRIVEIYVLDDINQYEVTNKYLFNGIIKSNIFIGLEVNLKHIDSNKINLLG